MKDTGLGMQPSTLKQLRNLQYSASSPGTKNEQGTGLGLMLCQTYLHKMKTGFDIESKWTKGSSFSFRLAIAPIESICKSTKKGGELQISSTSNPL